MRKKKSKIQSVQVSAGAVAILDEQLTKELMPDKKNTWWWDSISPTCLGLTGFVVVVVVVCGGGIVLLLVFIICQVCSQIACQLFNILYSFNMSIFA